MPQFEYKKFGSNSAVYRYDPSKKLMQTYTGAWTPELWAQETGQQNWGGITHQSSLTLEQAMQSLGATMGTDIGIPQQQQGQGQQGQQQQQQQQQSQGQGKYFAWAQTPDGRILSMQGEKQAVLDDIRNSGWQLAVGQEQTARYSEGGAFMGWEGGLPNKPEFDPNLQLSAQQQLPTGQVSQAQQGTTALRNIFLGGVEEETGKPIPYQQIPGSTQEEIDRNAANLFINPANLQETMAGLQQIIAGESAKPPGSYTEAWNKFLESSGLQEQLGGIKTALGGVQTAYGELPSIADLLTTARESRGLVADNTRLNELDVRLNEMETTIKNTQESVEEQYKGSKITQNQLNRLINAELSPISSDYRDLLAERNTLAGNVQRGETLAMQEATMQYNASMTGVKQAELEYSGLKDLYTLSRLGLAPEFAAMQADLERTFKASDEGRKALMDLMSEYPSAGISLEDDFTTAINKAALVNPGEIDKSLGLQTDDAGNVSVVFQDSETGEPYVTPVGQIGKSKAATGEKELLSNTNLNVLATSGVPPEVSKVITQAYRDGYTDDEIINYLESHGYGNAAAMVATYKDIIARVSGETIYSTD